MSKRSKGNGYRKKEEKSHDIISSYLIIIIAVVGFRCRCSLSCMDRKADQISRYRLGRRPSSIITSLSRYRSRSSHGYGSRKGALSNINGGRAGIGGGPGITGSGGSLSRSRRMPRIRSRRNWRISSLRSTSFSTSFYIMTVRTRVMKGIGRLT